MPIVISPVVFDPLALMWAAVALVLLGFLGLMLWTIREPDRATYTLPCPRRGRPAHLVVSTRRDERWTRIEQCSLCPLGQVPCGGPCLHSLG